MFNETSTTEEVLRNVDLFGKRVLITGVSAGLGIETARALVAHRAHVTGTARDLQKAQQAVEPARQAVAEGGGTFELVKLDLANLGSVSAAADRLVKNGDHFDIVIANAGVMGVPFGRTIDGFETQFGTNYVGHFVLLNRIRPLIPSGGRVVVLSSAAHGLSDIDLDDLNFDTTDYDPWIAYARSKTACVLLAVELDRRNCDRGVRATAVHPGTVRTELQRHYRAEQEAAYIALTKKGNASEEERPLRWKTVSQGAATSVWAAAVASAAAVGGHYCLDCQVAEINDTNGIRTGVRSYAVNPKRAEALWLKTEALTRKWN